MFALVWVAVACFGLVLVAMGRRVFADDEWEAGDWWAFDSWLLLRGLVFTFLFPTTRSPHPTRSAERTNAAIVIAWGSALLVLGGALLWYEIAR